MSAVADAVCNVCGIPADAGFFDASRIVATPALGEEVVLAEYQMHRSYCGTLLYFAQFSDLFAVNPAEVETPGLEWQIRCNKQPRDPYLTFDRIINPWGLSGFPIHLRLEEGCLIQLIVRNVAGTAIKRVGGRLLGRYWYNMAYGSLSNPR